MRSGIVAKLVVFLALLPVAVYGRVDIDPTAVNDPLTWTGGDITRVQDFCVQSTAGANPQNNTVIPYAVSADVAGTFELSSGAGVIPFTVQWTDLRTGIAESLAPGVVTAEDKTGESSGCPGGNNGRLTVFFASADLVAAVPGVYTGILTVEVSNSGGGRKKFRSRVTYDLTVPDSIRVTQLNTIPLGIFDGVNDLAGADSLCVYRRSGGLYTVVLSGDNTGGPFQLVNGGSLINYSVTWNDGNGAVAATPFAPITGQQNAYTLDEFCSGGAANNATPSVSVLANDLLAQATASGPHLGILRVVVQPE